MNRFEDLFIQMSIFLSGSVFVVEPDVNYFDLMVSGSMEVLAWLCEIGFVWMFDGSKAHKWMWFWFW